MVTPTETSFQLGAASKRIAGRVFVMVENRLQLLMLEAQEERERVLLAIWLALGTAVFGLLAGVALTVAVVVALGEHSPIIALLVLTVIYALAALLLYRRLVQLRGNWQTLSATLEQLKKDRECLEKTLL
jgi:uncharacterized membrane protein YqjE